MRKGAAYLQHYAPTPGRSFVVRDDGKIQVDPAKRFITPFTLVTEPEEILVPASVEMCPGLLAGGGVENAVILPIDNKGPFEAVYSQFTAVFASGPDAGQPTDQFMVVIFDPEFRPVLMNREIHVRTIAGGFGSSLGAGFGTAFQSAAGRPMVWPETFFMEPTEGGKALFLAYRNLTPYPIRVKWAFHGIRYYHLPDYRAAQKEKEAMYGKGRVSFPYFYTTDTDVRLLADESFDFDVRITDEADVEIVKMNVFSDEAFLWRLMEKAGKRFLDNSGPGIAGVANGIHSALGWGDAEFPFIPFETMYYEQNSKVMISLVNALSASPNRIFPTLCCRKIHHA